MTTKPTRKPSGFGECIGCKAVGDLFRGRCLPCKRALENEGAKRWYAANKNKARAMARDSAAKDRVGRREYTKAWRLANPDKVLVQKAKHNALRRDLTKTSGEYRRRQHDIGLKHSFGLTRAAFDRMLIAQSGRCAICSGELTGGKNGVHVDHDHGTGGVRALLCSQCNVGLGMFQDSPELLEAAARYLCERRPVLKLVSP